MKTKTAIEATATYKTPKLLVDNLKHVHDHGLAVEFAEQRLIDWVEHIRSTINGELVFKAGESELTILRNGNCTRTSFKPGRGYAGERIHYHCPSTGIKAVVWGGHPGYGHLDYMIFGITARDVVVNRLALPHDHSPHNRDGKGQDTFRIHIENNGAWWLLGESGLRAFAAHESRVKVREQTLDAAKTAQGSATLALEDFKARDLNAELRGLSQRLKTNTTELGKTLAHLDKSRTEKDHEQLRYLGVQRLWSAYSSTGSSPRYGFLPTRISFFDPVAQPGSSPRYGFLPTPESWSHPLVSFNYTVTLSENGEEFVLSSGIKCPVSVKQALAWLRGEAPAPMTVYGEVKVVDARDGGGNPLRVVTCGCHRLDLRPLGEEFAKLLAPKHKVKKIPSKPELCMNDAGSRRAFYSELRRRITERVRAAQDAHDTRRRDMINSRAVLKNTIKNRDAEIARLEASLAAASEAVMAAKKSCDEALSGVTGMTLAQANQIGVAICNKLIGIEAVKI